MMDAAKIDKIIQYALAVAGDADDFKDRSLGPIHLIKYVYLADLAYASANHGNTFTGAPWTFQHFGPWSVPVYLRIPEAAKAVGAKHLPFESDFDDKDVDRWSLLDSAVLVRQLDKELPIRITTAIRKMVSEYHNDTHRLLHEVYQTPPMLVAAPSEALDFTSVAAASLPSSAKQTPPPAVSAKQQKRHTQWLVDARSKMAERFAHKRGQAPPVDESNPVIVHPPRYDAVFMDGVKWLDRLAGDPIEHHDGTLEIDDSVWRSETRGSDVDEFR